MNRKSHLDLLRIAAALAVVVFHVMGSSAHNDPTVSLELQSALARCKSMLGWPVPVFFMTTGSLWLHPDKPCTYAKIMPNIRRFVLVLFTVGYAYALMERVFSAGILSGRLFVLSVGDVFTGNLWDHMWYLYAAIGVYLALPVLKPFFDTQPPKNILLLTGLLWFFTIAAPALEAACGYAFPIDFPLAAPLFYVCAGGMLARQRITRKAGLLAAGGFLICCLLLWMERLSPIHSLLTSLAAISIFAACTALLADRPSSKALRTLAECTFGIYLFQQFFINLMIKALHIYPLRYAPSVSIALASVAVFGLAFLAALALRKISMIRKYLL